MRFLLKLERSLEMVGMIDGLNFILHLYYQSTIRNFTAFGCGLMNLTREGFGYICYIYIYINTHDS